MNKTRKISKINAILIIAISLLVISIFSITLAYFTDSRNFTGELTFGDIQLYVTNSSNAEMVNGGTIPFTFGRENATKLMPGDTVTIKFNVALKPAETGKDNASEPAYYLVKLTDTKNVFGGDAYYYYNGTSVVKSDSTNHGVGELADTTAKHTFELKAEIATDFSEASATTNVTLQIFAVQQANLEKYAADATKSAWNILTSMTA